jgi:transcription termination/antitermination protein NusG
MFIANWYAIRTQSRAERMVRDALTHHTIDSYLPLMTRVSEWKGRHKCIEWALFPGYCFAKFNLSQRLLVTQAPGVVEIMGPIEGRPEAIPDEDIAAVRRVLECCPQYQTDLALEEGTRVEVMRGPLAGIQGKLIRKTDQCRLAVFIHVIGQGASVEIDPENTALICSSFQDSEKTTE